MRFLIDTNIFIPLEPTSLADVEHSTPLAAKLAELAGRTGCTLFVHPAGTFDLGRDGDPRRLELRRIQFQKYPLLPRPPRVGPHLTSLLGQPEEGSNDWVDNQLLASVDAESIDYLITEDVRMHRKASRAGLAHRVLTLSEAIELIKDLFDEPAPPLPAVDLTLAHDLDRRDQILQSFREDYPGFDEWLVKAKREQRPCWIIRGPANEVAAFALAKREDPPEYGLEGKVLKISSLKVSEAFNGRRYGELLLRSLFDHAAGNQYDWLYLTAYERHAELISLLCDFGFSQIKVSDRGELVLAKPMHPVQPDELDALAFNIRYGPRAVRWEGVETFLVPVQPVYHQLLFPELAGQLQLLPETHPCGNAIRKAYLCHSRTGPLRPGSLLFFYRSRQRQGATSVGVVEKSFRSQDPDQITRTVARRTVYRYQEIVALCRTEVLVILFRHAQNLQPYIRTRELVAHRVVGRAPQSIARVRSQEAAEWLASHMVA